MASPSTPDPNLDHLAFLVSSFTDNGKSLRAFTIHSRIQAHIGQYQNMQFAANIDNCFNERPPEIEHD